jgi:hypothetical protein
MLSFDNDLTFGNNRFIWQQQSQNALRVFKFRNNISANINRTYSTRFNFKRLEMPLNDVTAAISPDPEPHL